MQRSTYKELLIYRAWATCEFTGGKKWTPAIFADHWPKFSLTFIKYLCLTNKLNSWWILGCFPLCQTEDHWEFPTKMERHFPIKPVQPIGMALATVCFPFEFPNKGKEPVCQKWNDEFRSEYSNRNKWTTSRGDPEYSGQKKPKRTFPFEFQPKFPESLA